ncbi:MAG: murein biosynthesis integral membrane protein MurJ [Pseudomonadota bacterium]
MAVQARPIRMVASFMTVGVWTLASRILGFVREILIAAFIGAGPVAEAFFVAFSLPNMFRRFFAEGAFNTAFVPMFAKKVEADEAPLAFARQAFAGLATLLLMLTLIAQVAMPWLVLAMASGFVGDLRFDLATLMGRIAFPYILLISLAAALSGVLNSIGRFAAAAAAPVLLNVILIAALLAAEMGLGPEFPVPTGEDPTGLRHGTLLTLAVPLAGLAQLALVWWAAARAGFPVRLSPPRLSPDLKRLAIIAGPAMLAGGVVQINLLVGRQVASFFDGAIVWLSFADRLYQLPLGVIGIALGVVLLPELSRRLRAGEGDAAQASLSRAAELALALTLPAAVILVIVPLPVVSVLFERGAFTADDTANTALALAVYGLGLPAFVMQRVLQPVYFARADTVRPFRYALVAMVVNAVIAIGLGLTIGFIGAAIATTLAGWVMLGLLARGRRNFGPETQFDRRFRKRLWGMIAASVGLGAILWAVLLTLGPMFGLEGWRYLALGILLGTGLGGYLLLAQIFGALRISELRGALRR